MTKLALVVQTTDDAIVDSRSPGPVLGDLEHWADMLLRWFEGSQTAQFIISEDGAFISANAAGRALLTEETVLRVAAGKVHAVCSKSDAELGAAFRSGRTTALLLEEPAAGEVWFVRATPGAGLLVCELRKARVQEPQPSLEILQACGLTRAERRMLQHLLTARSIEEIARLEGISVETVRTHRKRAFGKVGVASRFELAELVLRSTL